MTANFLDKIITTRNSPAGWSGSSTAQPIDPSFTTYARVGALLPGWLP
jgi:hypothetical protein